MFMFSSAGYQTEPTAASVNQTKPVKFHRETSFIQNLQKVSTPFLCSLLILKVECVRCLTTPICVYGYYGDLTYKSTNILLYLSNRDVNKINTKKPNVCKINIVT